MSRFIFSFVFLSDQCSMDYEHIHKCAYSGSFRIEYQNSFPIKSYIFKWCGPKVDHYFMNESFLLVGKR